MTDFFKEKKSIILSGIQPSGKLTIGNLIGALKNWVALQDEYNCYFMIADMHSITVRMSVAELRQQTLDTAAILLACGIEPEKSVIFIQSQVPEHAQLTWVLSCYTSIGECSRMTQFKDKSEQHSDNVNVGLFTYPVLMAADILLYQANLVPVGEDQKQHLELSRNIAQRFNYYYSETFTIPEPYIPEVGARVMSLQDPTKKMSKSDDNQNSILYITDSDEDIKRKIKRAKTDSGTEIIYRDDKPGIQNLMTLYHIATQKSFDEIQDEFKGKGYGDFKVSVANAVAEYLAPIRIKYFEVRKDTKLLQTVLEEGARIARNQAIKTIRKVYKKVGIVSF